MQGENRFYAAAAAVTAVRYLHCTIPCVSIMISLILSSAHNSVRPARVRTFVLGHNAIVDFLCRLCTQKVLTMSPNLSLLLDFSSYFTPSKLYDTIRLNHPKNITADDLVIAQYIESTVP